MVTISRGQARNAVDGPTAEALAHAFREFDQDPGADVAILYGDEGTFCAGADLKAVARGEGANRLDEEGDGIGNNFRPVQALNGRPIVKS